ncbi:MAG: hypothetical protein AAB662_00435 [Patescibacteria group bacterium]
MTTEVRRGPSVMRFEPAAGEAKKRLERECEILLNKKTESFTPSDFEAFVHKMVSLLGRFQEFSSVSTPELVDKKYDRAISLIMRNSTKETDIYILTAWSALPEPQREAVRSEITEPFLSEVVSTKHSEGGNKVTVVVRRDLIYPPKSEKKYMSYVTGELIGSDIKVLRLGESVLAGEQSKTLANRIFALYRTNSNKTPHL